MGQRRCRAAGRLDQGSPALPGEDCVDNVGRAIGLSIGAGVTTLGTSASDTCCSALSSAVIRSRDSSIGCPYPLAAIVQNTADRISRAAVAGSMAGLVGSGSPVAGQVTTWNSSGCRVPGRWTPAGSVSGTSSTATLTPAPRDGAIRDASPRNACDPCAGGARNVSTVAPATTVRGGQLRRRVETQGRPTGPPRLRRGRQGAPVGQRHPGQGPCHRERSQRSPRRPAPRPSGPSAPTPRSAGGSTADRHARGDRGENTGRRGRRRERGTLPERRHRGHPGTGAR